MSLSCLISPSKSILYLLVLRNISALMRKPLIQRSPSCQLLTFYSLQPLLLGDPQHQTFLLSPLPCTRLSTSRLTVVTPSLYRPHPNTISLLSTCRHIVFVSPSPPCHTITSCFHHSYIPFFVFTYIFSVILLTSLFFYFMVPFLFAHPDISVPLFIYPLFLAKILLLGKQL